VSITPKGSSELVGEFFDVRTQVDRDLTTVSRVDRRLGLIKNLGRHISPLLFVMVADLLQSIINREAREGHLEHLLGNSFGGDFPIVQYADDTLLILSAEEQQLVHLQAILLEFAASTGLKVNFTKSMIVPINVHPDKTTFLAQVFGCQVGKIPFTYLGLPLGTTRPSVQDDLPLVSRIERRLMGITPLLSYAGRLTLVNSVLSAMPTFYLSTLKIHIIVIEQIDIYRKHYLWDRGDINHKGGCLVA
jgi:hypothetical protein